MSLPRTLINFAAFQAGWFACVAGAAHGLPWLGPLLVLPVAGWHLANAEPIQPILEATYGVEQAEMWRNRWRIFFMSCAELFGFRDGQEWWVSHYLFERAV